MSSEEIERFQEERPVNGYKLIFGENIGSNVDIKSKGIRSRTGKVIHAYSDFVLIDFDHLSSFCPGGLFYVSYRHIIDFQVVRGTK